MSAPLPSFDRYAVEAELGSGGFGAVYRARHLVLGRKVALKVLHPQRQGDVEVMQRFLREARAVASLGSPHIVQVLDADMTSDGRAFIAMELLEGEDLAERLQKTARLPAHTVIRIGREILAALVVAHAQGVVHRDLKPGNVFLARTPQGDDVAKVLDFGISKVRTEAAVDQLTQTGTMLGTPHYMAPEQFRSSRDVDGRADLYSLGVLLYEALAGRLPFQGETLHQLIAAKLSDPPPPLTQIAPYVPAAVAAVVMRALEVEPDRRFASAAEMDAALASVERTVSAPGVTLSGRPAPIVSSPPVAPAPRTSASTSRLFAWMLGIFGVVAFVAFALLAMAMLGAVVAEQQVTAWWNGDGAPATTAPPTSVVPPSTFAPPPTYVPVPVYVPPPTTVVAPTGDTAGVSLTAQVMGMVPSDAVAGVVSRARPALAACRGPRAFREHIQMVIMTGGSLGGGDVTMEDEAIHSCVVAAIRASGPASTALPGTARFDVALDPR